MNTTSTTNTTEQAIEEFLEGQPRADSWREMRESLAARLHDTLAALKAAPESGAARTSLERKVRELRAQVAALTEEEAVTRFVEDSVRATLAQTTYPSEDEDDEAGC